MILNDLLKSSEWELGDAERRSHHYPKLAACSWLRLVLRACSIGLVRPDQEGDQHAVVEQEARWPHERPACREASSRGASRIVSPKRNSNGARTPFYESMREVAPGDIIFSFVDTRMAAIGVAQSYCWESPKPTEFGEAGQNWETVGWKVKIRFTNLLNKMRPKDHMGILSAVLPER